MFNVGFNHFFVGSIKLVSARPDEVMPLVMQTFHDSNKHGFVAFNNFSQHSWRRNDRRGGDG